jgi:hypothetical protein
VAACAVPVVAVGAAVAWTVVVPLVVVVVVVVVVGVALVVPDVVVPPSAVTIAVVEAPEVPSYDRAAMVLNPPTAATLAMLVPIVRARRRATARSRSAGLRRVDVFMVTRSSVDPFANVTVILHLSNERRAPARGSSRDRKRAVTVATSGSAIFLQGADAPIGATLEEHP